MIIRTITAACDDEVCERQVTLRPNTSQPFLELSAIGWSTPVKVIERGPHGHAVQKTFCPEHS